MHKRFSYTIKRTGLSTQNEPYLSFHIEACIRQYPDMFSVYQSFCSFFNVQMQNVILSNGCENALKNVLLALKPYELAYSTPSWGMVEVICNQCNVRTKTQEYKIEQNNIAIDREFSNIDIYYATSYANNLLYTNLNTKNVDVSNVTIIDLSYASIDDIKHTFSNFDYNGKVIYIGSFDKLIGCGLRCGFALFPTKYSDVIQLQREQYINALAAKFLQNISSFCFPVDDSTYLIKKQFAKYIVAATNNYMTIQLPNSTLVSKLTIPHKLFQCNGKIFVRFGIPINQSESMQLIEVLEDVCA